MGNPSREALDVERALGELLPGSIRAVAEVMGRDGFRVGDAAEVYALMARAAALEADVKKQRARLRGESQ